MKPFTFCIWLVVIAVVSYLVYQATSAGMRRITTPPSPPAVSEQLTSRAELLRALGELGAEGL